VTVEVVTKKATVSLRWLTRQVAGTAAPALITDEGAFQTVLQQAYECTVYDGRTALTSRMYVEWVDVPFVDERGGYQAKTAGA